MGKSTDAALSNSGGKSGWETWMPWLLGLAGAATTGYTGYKSAQAQEKVRKNVSEKPQYQNQTQLAFGANMAAALYPMLISEALNRYSGTSGRPGGSFMTPEALTSMLNGLTGNGSKVAGVNDFLYGFNIPSQGKV